MDWLLEPSCIRWCCAPGRWSCLPGNQFVAYLLLGTVVVNPNPPSPILICNLIWTDSFTHSFYYIINMWDRVRKDIWYNDIIINLIIEQLYILFFYKISHTHLSSLFSYLISYICFFRYPFKYIKFYGAIPPMQTSIRRVFCFSWIITAHEFLWWLFVVSLQKARYDFCDGRLRLYNCSHPVTFTVWWNNRNWRGHTRVLMSPMMINLWTNA